METTVSSASKQVTISDQRPTVLIGERINPTGKKKLTAALQEGDLSLVQEEATAQVKAGAGILDVNVGVPGLDEAALLPRAVQAVMEVVNAPVCIDSSSVKALEAGLKVYQGKALVNSVNGEERSLASVLPVVKQYGAAVIGLTMDEEGIPPTAEKRLAIAHKIVERAESVGIPREDVVIDCLALTVGADATAGMTTIETIRRVNAELGVNITLGASNISFGMPDRELLNSVFLAIAVAAGLTCPVVDAAKVRAAVLAADLSLGRDPNAMRYIRAFRQRQKS
jgi:5-methyltetrahydrofolate--homocysteine methyltransferase